MPENVLPASVRVSAGTTAGTALRDAGAPNKGPEAIVVVRDPDGALRDLSWAPESDVDVEPVRADSEAGRSVIRHSTAHVLAQAVQELFPDAKLGSGRRSPTASITTSTSRTLHARGPRSPREEDEAESSRVAAVLARVYSSLDESEGRTRPTSRTSSSCRRQGIRRRPRGDGGRVGRAHRLRQPQSRTGERIWGATCAVGRTCRRPSTSRRSRSPAARPPIGAVIRRRPACSASRHRLGVSGGPRHPPGTLAEAERRDNRPPRRGARPVQLPREIGSGLPVVPPQGRHHPQETRGLLALRHAQAGYEFVYSPRHEGVAVRAVGHLEWYSEGMYPRHATRRGRNADGTVPSRRSTTTSSR